MASVIVFNAAHIAELTDGAVVGATINSDGELILEPQAATAINVGQIGRSVGLGKDIHFTNPDASDQFLETATVEEESTDQDLGTAPNRWMGLFKPYGLPARAVSWFNEYMEFRLAAAKHNTSAFVIYVRENATVQTHARNDTIPLFVLRDDRDLRTHFWGLYNNGIVRVGPNAIQDVPTILLGPTDPIPTGTPNPCIVYRTT